MQGSILISEDLQAELSEVLLRYKFDRYLSAEKRLRFLTNFISLAIPTAVTQSITICRDPKDNMVLELAVCGQASYILTGDKDLLVLHPFRDISILSPHHFLEEYTGERK